MPTIRKLDVGDGREYDYSLEARADGGITLRRSLPRGANAIEVTFSGPEWGQLIHDLGNDRHLLVNRPEEVTLADADGVGALKRELGILEAAKKAAAAKEAAEEAAAIAAKEAAEAAEAAAKAEKERLEAEAAAKVAAEAKAAEEKAAADLEAAKAGAGAEGWSPESIAALTAADIDDLDKQVQRQMGLAASGIAPAPDPTAVGTSAWVLAQFRAIKAAEKPPEG